MGGVLEVWPYCIKEKFMKTVCCIKIYEVKCMLNKLGGSSGARIFMDLLRESNSADFANP